LSCCLFVFVSFVFYFFFFSSRRRHTRSKRDWSSDVCSSDLGGRGAAPPGRPRRPGWRPRPASPPRRTSPAPRTGPAASAPCRPRSEERRVGKEGRSRWSPKQEKQKETNVQPRHRGTSSAEED